MSDILRRGSTSNHVRSIESCMSADSTKRSVLTYLWHIDLWSRSEYRLLRDICQIDEVWSWAGRLFSFQDTETSSLVVQNGTTVQSHSRARSPPSPWSRIHHFWTVLGMFVEFDIVEEDLLAVELAPRQRQQTGSKPNIDNQTASRQELISTVLDRPCLNTRKARI